MSVLLLPGCREGEVEIFGILLFNCIFPRNENPNSGITEPVNETSVQPLGPSRISQATEENVILGWVHTSHSNLCINFSLSLTHTHYLYLCLCLSVFPLLSLCVFYCGCSCFSWHGVVKGMTQLQGDRLIYFYSLDIVTYRCLGIMWSLNQIENKIWSQWQIIVIEG